MIYFLIIFHENYLRFMTNVLQINIILLLFKNLIFYITKLLHYSKRWVIKIFYENIYCTS